MRISRVAAAAMIVLLALLLVAGSNCLFSAPADLKPYEKLIAKLTPLATPLDEPKSGEWLFHHKENGQTFAEYVRADPNMPRGKRKIIYIQPLGEFDKTQRKIVDLTAEFMRRYFGCEVKVKEDLPLTLIPKSARRIDSYTHAEQILTTYVLHTVLKPRLPDDAAAMIAFTATDLYPSEDWNFVFGQASTSERVGVWSIAQNGIPAATDEEFKTCLIRTIKTATHETGHMFTMQHCTKYMCNMCGSNSQDEADRQPIEVCPECLAKICYATGVDPKKRFERLLEFCEKNGLEKQAEFYKKSIEAVK